MHHYSHINPSLTMPASSLLVTAGNEEISLYHIAPVRLYTPLSLFYTPNTYRLKRPYTHALMEAHPCTQLRYTHAHSPVTKRLITIPRNLLHK